MDQALLNSGAQLGAKGSIGYQANRATQQIFDKEKHAEVASGGTWSPWLEVRLQQGPHLCTINALGLTGKCPLSIKRHSRSNHGTQTRNLSIRS